MGPGDGSGNVITASAEGTAHLTTVMLASPVSWDTFQEGFIVPDYVLDAPVAQFAIWGAYHIDGKTWGPFPDEQGVMNETWVGHFYSVVETQ